MLRQIIIPDKNIYPLHLPKEFVGKKVEVIAFTVSENQMSEETGTQKQETKYSLVDNRNFYSKFRFGTLRIKFTRDELYDR